jgi:hypothetical protein
MHLSLLDKSWIMECSQMHLGQQLGKGVFGSVYAATCSQQEGKQLAVKQQVIKLSSGVPHLRIRLAWCVDLLYLV